MGLFSRRRSPTGQDGLDARSGFPPTPFISFRPEPVLNLPKQAPSLPSKPYFWGPISPSGPNDFLGRPTPVPAISIGLPEPTPTNKTPSPPKAGPAFSASQGVPAPPPAAHAQPVPAASGAPTSLSQAQVQSGKTDVWPAIAFEMPSGDADNRWASVEYLLPREGREGLGNEFRFCGQRTFSNTLKRALFDP